MLSSLLCLLDDLDQAPALVLGQRTGLHHLNLCLLYTSGEHLVAQVVIHAVQSLDGLTVAGTADNNAAIGQALVVERLSLIHISDCMMLPLYIESLQSLF